MTTPGPQENRIITFYSYKGGTGRTMAVANIAWILASGGKKVLVIDWDLESPGLHRYFHPFLFDKELRSSRGIIDLISDYAMAKMERASDNPDSTEDTEDTDDTDWIGEAVDIRGFVTALDWDFPNGGRIDFMPAGLQDQAYSTAVNTFDWEGFYKRLSGAAFLAFLRDRMREHYDYVVIDSRTGLNDVAGICTVEMPDVVVDCFTMSTQSIEGAVAVAKTITAQRAHDPIRVLPVPMRVEDAEHEKLEAGRDYARHLFAPFLEHLDPDRIDRYWGELEIPYRPLFAYEEILAPFGERPHQGMSVLTACERLAWWITEGAVDGLHPMPERKRRQWLAKFERSRQGTTHDVFISYASINRMWAEWVAAELEDGGRSTRLHAIDQTSGAATLDEMRQLAASADRVVVLLSRHYTAVPNAVEFWKSVASPTAGGQGRRMVAIRIDGRRLPAPFTEHSVLDFFETGAEQASQLVHEAFDLVLADDHTAAGSDGRRPRFPAAPPPVWNVPRRGTAFVGRGEVLESLRDRLSTDVTVMMPQALYGLGGVGKSQMAVEYANRFAADYDVVWWIDAEQLGAARKGLFDLGAALKLPTGDDMAETVEIVRDALRRGEPYQRWLIIFDNAERPEDLYGLIPQGHGHVLITSRNQEWIRYMPTVELGVFTRPESVELLRTQVKGLKEEDADLVAARLGDLPLALQQAAAWLKLNATPVKEYLRLLDSEPTQMLDKNEPADYKRTAAATWLLSFNQLRERRPAASVLLELCSFFGPEPIPVSLLAGERFTALITRDDPQMSDPILQHQMIRQIGQYALAHVDVGTNSIRLHRLVQAVIRERLSEDDQDAMRRNAQEILAAADPGDPDIPDHWPRYADLWQHARPTGMLQSPSDTARRFVINLVRYLYLQNDFDSSRELADEALEFWRGHHDDDDVTTLRLRFHLANVWRSQADYQKARAVDEEILAKFRSYEGLGPSHLYTLMVARSLGGDLRVSGEYDRAQELDEETVALFAASFGDDHPQTLRSKNNLAVTLRLLGKFHQATDLDDQIYQTYLRRWGRRDRSTLSSASNLGRDLRDIGELERSLHLLRQTHEIQMEVNPDNHDDTLSTGSYLALTLRQMGRYVESHELIQDTLRRYLKVHSPTNLDVMSCEMIFASTCSALGDNIRAQKIAEEVLVRYRAVLTDTNALTLACMNNLGVFLLKGGKPAQARPVSEEARDRFRDDLGDKHPYVLAAALNLANDLYALGDSQAARELDEATYPVLVEVLGEDHPDTAGAGINLALSRRATGDEQEAAPLYDDALGRLVEIFGEDNRRVTKAKALERENFYVEPPQT